MKAKKTLSTSRRRTQNASASGASIAPRTSFVAAMADALEDILRTESRGRALSSVA